ncbi:hypothetical protein DFH09DRAFT_1114143 [Mycena vulgaris]|nr:hypothetical protein DFH09DRAFT_1114143 [Mycena vulgaris]
MAHQKFNRHLHVVDGDAHGYFLIVRSTLTRRCRASDENMPRHEIEANPPRTSSKTDFEPQFIMALVFSREEPKKLLSIMRFKVDNSLMPRETLNLTVEPKFQIFFSLALAAMPYQLADSTTYQLFELKHGKAEKAWYMDHMPNTSWSEYFSSQCPQEEFKRLVETHVTEQVPLPTRKDVDDRYAEMQELIANGHKQAMKKRNKKGTC